MPKEISLREFLETKLDASHDILVQKIEANTLLTNQTLEQAKLTNGRLKEMEEYKPMLQEIKAERKDFKKRITDYIWKFGHWIIIAIMGLIIKFK